MFCRIKYSKSIWRGRFTLWRSWIFTFKPLRLGKCRAAVKFSSPQTHVTLLHYSWQSSVRQNESLAYLSENFLLSAPYYNFSEEPSLFLCAWWYIWYCSKCNFSGVLSYISLFSDGVAMPRGIEFPFFCPFVHAKVHFGKRMQVFLAIKLGALTVLMLLASLCCVPGVR